MKQYKNGLVLGKFLPFTLGHKHLINTALTKCKFVHVMVCSLENEPINGLLRYQWLLRTFSYNPNVMIYWCQDENPQKPEECTSTDEFYNKYWCPSVYSRIGIDKLDVVFTSEEYGDEFAKYLGVKHELVDIDRLIVPVSGTSVRENPFKMWDFIPDVVKPYYTKKIVVMGPESTGKSTLVKKLAQHYNTNYVEEYGRTYCEKYKPASEFTIGDFESIAQNHFFMINNDVHKSNKFLFIDTEAITTKLFGEMYLENFKSEDIDLIINLQKFDLVLFMGIDVPWVDDGTRDFSDETIRNNHYLRIKNELINRNYNFVEINGDYEERFKKSVIEIDKYC